MLVVGGWKPTDVAAVAGPPIRAAIFTNAVRRDAMHVCRDDITSACTTLVPVLQTPKARRTVRLRATPLDTHVTTSTHMYVCGYKF